MNNVANGIGKNYKAHGKYCNSFSTVFLNLSSISWLIYNFTFSISDAIKFSQVISQNDTEWNSITEIILWTGFKPMPHTAAACEPYLPHIRSTHRASVAFLNQFKGISLYPLGIIWSKWARTWAGCEVWIDVLVVRHSQEFGSSLVLHSQSTCKPQCTTSFSFIVSALVTLQPLDHNRI